MDSVGVFLNCLKQGTYSVDFFDAGITLLEENLSNGLPTDSFKLIVDIITKVNIKRATQVAKLVKCLVPEEGIENKDLGKIIVWVLTHHDIKPASLITAILEWLVGVLEFGLADKSYVNGYYELFYSILFNGKLERVISHLLFVLTRPEDVYRGRVVDVLALHEHNSKARHTMALLSLFKSYKPEYVPEKVQFRNTHAAFNTIKPSLANNLRLAQRRLQHEGGDLNRKGQEYCWNRWLVKQNVKLIPDAAYVHLGSSLYQEKRKTVIQCLDKKAIMNSQLCTEVPSRVLTLLLNEGGIHLLATHDPVVHVRFSFTVYYTLRTALIERRFNVPREECEYFLKQLVDLEDYMQQGIPVVSLFLAEYICTWDGLEYREYIYRLLERMSFKTDSELEYCILDFLNSLFITGSVEEKCLIIRTLQRLVMNLVICSRSESGGADKEMLLTFLGRNPFGEVDLNAAIARLANAVDKLCIKGLQMTNSHPLLLHSCIIFYEMLAEIEVSNTSWFVIPRACVYRCLLGPSVSALSRTCDVLLKHKEIYSQIRAKANSDRENCAVQISMLTEYSFDIYNCLVREKALSKAHQGHIFKSLTDLQKKKFCGGDSAFGVTSTVAMNAFIMYMRHEEGAFSLESTLSLFRSGFTGLCKYLDFLAIKAGDA